MNGKAKHILISAGGTGGHMFPAEALAKDLLDRGFKVSLATDVRGSKYKFADGVPTHVLKSGAMKSGLLSKLKTAGALFVGRKIFQLFFMSKMLFLAGLMPI